MCDVTRSPVWRDSFTCVTSIVRKCDVTHSYMLYCVCGTWLITFVTRAKWKRLREWRGSMICGCDVTTSHVRHGSFAGVTWLIHVCFVCECDSTYTHTHTHINTHVYTYTYTYTNSHTHTHVQIYAHMGRDSPCLQRRGLVVEFAYTHKNTHTHTHTHTRRWRFH